MARTLYGITISPWTERARWALEHHGLSYRYHEHLPMLGEPLLRRKAGVSHATVPLLEDDGRVVMGSVEIARHADRFGSGEALFPGGRDADVARWAELAEGMLRVGRAWMMRRLIEDRGALAASLPRPLPASLRSVLAPGAAMVVRFIANKHDVPRDVEREVEHTLRPLLLELREALAAKGATDGPRYLLGEAGFSAADLLVAVSLNVVRPPKEARLQSWAREVWTNPALVDDFGDLLEWRDAIYAKHR